MSTNELLEEMEKLQEEKSQGYRERNQLVCLISKVFPATLERHPEEEEWDDGWRWIVHIALPTGQATWHIYYDDLPMFDHLQRELGIPWDGHTTQEKYQRVVDVVDLGMSQKKDLLDAFHRNTVLREVDRKHLAMSMTGAAEAKVKE